MNLKATKQLRCGTDIYLFIGTRDGKVCKYNTITDTYAELADTPYNILMGPVVSVRANIYLLGNNTDTNYIDNYSYIYNINLPAINKYQYNEIITTEQLPTTLENNSIYIIYGTTYATKLLEQLVLNFTSVSLYKDNETQPYPIYYGNGTEWVKILN